MPILPESSFPDLRLTATTVHDGRHLPCWEAQGAVYHVSLHLADSVPADERRAWTEARAELTARARTENRRLTAAEAEELAALYQERVERFLASGYGSCVLREPEIQSVVRSVLEHDNARLYALHVWCLMPNHLHILVGGVADGVSLRKLVGDWKHILAHRINRATGSKGGVWHEDSYTRIIRDADEYRNQVKYIWHNPESAGLNDGFVRESYIPFDFSR